MLIAGTHDGVYRFAENESEKVLNAGRVMRVRQFDGVPGVFAATKTGLYHSQRGEEWMNLAVPREEVYSVCASPSGERLYAGTHPAHLYVCSPTGSDAFDWQELSGFQELPSRDEWYTPRHRNESHIRSLGTHSDHPERVIAGVEVGGVHVSDDNGVTWAERRITDETQHSHDIHHVHLLNADSYVASTGSGLYRTRNAGRSWTRLDADFEHSYFREAFADGERLYAAATRGPPPTWGGEQGLDGALFESTDQGERFERVSYPGEPEDFVLSWTMTNDGSTVFAGTHDGRILRRTDGEWTLDARLPTGIASLSVTED